MSHPRNMASVSDHELRLFGTIGEDITADHVLDLLDQHHVECVRLNSPGGFVFEGIAIHSALAERGLSVIIDGIAASIASVIAMAGQRVEMTAGSMLMIHNPWNIATGDAAELRKSADVLDQIADSLVTIYQRRTGITDTAVRQMMAAETWLTADQAVELGFADAIIDSDQPADIDSLNLSILCNARHAPERIAACIRNSRNSDMTTTSTTTKPSRRQRAAARETEAQARASTIRAEVQAHSLPPDFAQRLIDDGLDLPAARAAITSLAEHMAQDAGPRSSHVTGLTGGTPYGGHDDFTARASDAIVARATGRRTNDPELASTSLAGLAEMVCQSTGTRPRSRRPHDMIRAALSTSDFPAILENALHKSIRSGLDSELATHRAWVRISEAQDFRDQRRPILSSAPDLEKVNEGGEYKHGAFSDEGSGFKIEKFGKIISLTLEAMVNDDLDAFGRIAPALGRAAARKEADAVYSTFTSDIDGPVMPDGNRLFSAAHNNIISGQPFGQEALGKARAAMRRQKDVTGSGWLNLTPRWLIVPPEMEHQSLVLLRDSTVERTSTSTTTGTDPQTTTGQSLEGAAPWLNELTLIVEPRLEVVNAAYLAAPFDLIDTIELATGPDSPTIQQRDGWEIDAVEWKVRHIFGAGALDWRGLVRIDFA